MSPKTVSAYSEFRAHFDVAPLGYLERASAVFRKFVAAGGRLVAGIDPVLPGVLPGLADQRNYELLVEAGFAAEQAVQIMTANGASLLGIASVVGTLQPGKIADLVVVNGDPGTPWPSADSSKRGPRSTVMNRRTIGRFCSPVSRWSRSSHSGDPYAPSHSPGLRLQSRPRREDAESAAGSSGRRHRTHRAAGA